MSGRRVYDVAKELGVASKDLVRRLKQMGVPVKSHASTIEQDVVDRLLSADGAGDGAKAAAEAPAKPAEAPAKPPEAPAATQAEAPPAAEKAPEPPKAPEQPKSQEPEAKPADKPEEKPAEKPAAQDEKPAASGAPIVHHGVTIKEFAEKTGVSAPEVMKVLMRQGSMKTITQSMTDEEILVVAEELGVEVDVVSPEEEEQIEEAAAIEAEAVVAAAAGELESRPPVVTVMGHVDHGKTTVLDRIRETDVAAGEHGGITQHIGAYQVTKDGQKITFIDTPGHEAFTAMRARGAQVTDLAILVVAADDGVMPQTREALDHARAAHVPVIVAVNKIDRPDADLNRPRTQLAELGVQPQEWGGDTLFVDISAKEGTNLDELLVGITLVAEELDLKAVSEGPAKGVVLEAHLDRGRGAVATVLVQHGTLNVGDVIVAGAAWGKVRALFDEYDDALAEAGPSKPVVVLGWNSVPETGADVRVVADERQARQIAQERDAARRAAELVARRPVSLAEVFKRGTIEELVLIVKADVQGSVEALADALQKIDVGDVNLNILHKGVGAVTENDVMLARASGAIIVGFNVRPDPKSRELAEREGVDIRSYRVIYQAIEEIEQALTGLLAPEYREVVLGNAEIREIFRSSRAIFAGCYVTNGEIQRNAQARLLRDGTVVFEGRIGSLKRFKDDVRNVAQGFECGIGLDGYNDIKVGDVIEAFEVREIART